MSETMVSPQIKPALDDAMSYLRAGDTPVVTKLDRLGPSVRSLKQVVNDLQAKVGPREVSQVSTPLCGWSKA